MDEMLPLDFTIYSQFVDTVKEKVKDEGLDLCPVTAREPDASDFQVADSSEILFSVSN
ncbi:MAG: hypothetical protein MJ211_16190 [Bacteroidales bacterium]|nr:hypothetical protein [Bacteroidales bacterium]